MSLEAKRRRYCEGIETRPFGERLHTVEGCLNLELCRTYLFIGSVRGVAYEGNA